MGLNVVADQLSSPSTLIEEIRNQMPVTVTTLTTTGYCDFLWWGSDGKQFTLERKTVHDLSGRLDDLEKQLKKAMGVADEVILLIEGLMSPIEHSTMLYRRKKDGSAYYQDRVATRPYQAYMGFIFRLDRLGISTVFTSCPKGTAHTIVEMVRICNKPETQMFKRYIRSKPVIAPQNPQVMKLMGLGVGQKRAEALIDKYKTVWKVVNSSPDELATVDGIGSKIATDLLQGIGRRIT
jgi:ERCC4-type nuclease